MCPGDVFAEASGYIASEDRYETFPVAGDRSPVRAANKMLMIADHTFQEVTGGLDILLVAGGSALPDADPDPLLTEWLKAAPWRASIYGSICTGAFALGHAGLLDQRRCTTHWQNAAKLAVRFPSADVVPDLIYARDGRMVTSAGVTAGIDLALSLVAQRHGPQVAVAVAKRLVVVAQRQGGQSQFSPYLTAPADAASPIAKIQDFVMANIGSRHSLEDLAVLVGMSGRNLSRHFVQETGITPHEFVERARVDAARKLLESTELPLKAVAYACGFGTADLYADRLQPQVKGHTGAISCKFPPE